MEGDDLSEIKELLRTAGVAVVGELIQHRDSPHPNHYLGQGKVEELKALLGPADANLVVADDELTPRQERNLEKALDKPVHRPHRGDPRHLRQPRPHGRGQAPGRARPARVQHGPHAGAVDAPRASRRRPRRGRHRHPRPRRVPDRDGPPARARPHHRAQAPAGPCALHPRRAARRARAGAPAERRAGRLHERRQVDAAQRAHRLHRRRPRPAVPHAGPDDAHAAAARPHVPDDRHRRLHPQAAHQLVDAFAATLEETRARRPRAARGRRVRARGGARGDGARRRGRARGDPRRPTRRACWCSTRPTRSTRSAAPSWPSAIPTPCS